MSYKNIAQIYSQSRPSYPPELFKRIISQVSNKNRNIYVDLGCGTGELLLPLSMYFKKSVGVDPEKAMLSIAADKIERQQLKNISLVQNTATKYLAQLPEQQILDLITAGRSFHWMDQKKVVDEIKKRLKSGGVFASLGEMSGGIWRRQDDWAKAVRQIIDKEFPNKNHFKPIKGNKVSLHDLQKNMRSASFPSINSG